MTIITSTIIIIYFIFIVDLIFPLFSDINILTKYKNLKFNINILPIRLVMKFIFLFYLLMLALISVILFIYKQSPIIFKWFSKSVLELDMDQLNQLEEIDKLGVEIIDHKETILLLEEEKKKLLFELNKAVSEKEGFIKGIENIKIIEDPLTKKIVFWGTAVILISIAGFYYYNNGGAELFKPVIDLIQSNTDITTRATTQHFIDLAKKINITEKQIQDLTMKLDTIQTMLSELLAVSRGIIK